MYPFDEDNDENEVMIDNIVLEEIKVIFANIVLKQKSCYYTSVSFGNNIKPYNAIKNTQE